MQPGLGRRIHLWGVKRPKIYYIAPPSICAVAIYAGSLAPPTGLGGFSFFSFPGADKLIHVGVYAVFALSIIRGWQREKMPPLDLHVMVFALALVYGAMIEVFQALTPYRTFEMLDIAADGIGAILGQVTWHLVMMRWGKRTKLYPGLLRPDFEDSPANRRKKRA